MYDARVLPVQFVNKNKHNIIRAHYDCKQANGDAGPCFSVYMDHET